MVEEQINRGRRKQVESDAWLRGTLTDTKAFTDAHKQITTQTKMGAEAEVRVEKAAIQRQKERQTETERDTVLHRMIERHVCI